MLKRTMALGVAVLAAGLLLSNGGAWGQESDTAKELERYKQRTEALEKKVEQLDKSKGETAGATDDQIGKAVQRLLKEKENPTDFRVFWKDGLNFETSDKNFTLSLGGRVLYDVMWLDEDADLRRFAPIGDQADATGLRAARLHASGTMYGNMDFKVEVDFAGTAENTSVLKDAYLGFRDLVPHAYVKVGHFKEPFSLEELTSGRFTTFMERGLPNVFAPARNAGAALSTNFLDKRMTAAAGVFIDANNQGFGVSEGGYNYTARVTGLPWYEDHGRQLLHLGAAASYRNPRTGVQFRQRPEMNLASRFVDTGVVLADDVQLLGGEAALVLGPFSVQSEYIRADVNRDGASGVDFSGGYVQASYFLTGENRAYSTSSGAFGRVKPKRNFQKSKDGERGWGAWEVGARYSWLDLSDRAVKGGQLGDVTLGLNWYINPNMRIMTNYVHARLDDRTAGDVSGDADMLGLRFQVDF